MSSSIFVKNNSKLDQINVKNKETLNIYLIASDTENLEKTVNVNLNNNCNVNLYCLVLANNAKKVLNFNFNHKSNGSISNIYVYALTNNKAYIDINCVSSAASKTLKNQINQTINGLIFDNDSEIKALPCLDIYTNTINAKHTVNIGQVDPEIIFYLNSKGLNNQQAYSFLIDSFIQQLKPMIDKYNINLKAALAAVTGGK